MTLTMDVTHQNNWIRWQFLKKLNRELPYDPAVLLLGIYPKEFKGDSKRYLYTSVQPALFTRAKKVETTQTSIDE